MGGWGSKVPNKYMEFCPKNFSFFLKKILIFSKKLNALNSLKNKINLAFIFHLVESQTCAVGGWGPMFGTKSQKKLFFGHPPLSLTLSVHSEEESLKVVALLKSTVNF